MPLLGVGGEEESSSEEAELGRMMEITSGRSFRFCRWRQVGLLQGIAAIKEPEPIQRTQ